LIALCGAADGAGGGVHPGQGHGAVPLHAGEGRVREVLQAAPGPPAAHQQERVRRLGEEHDLQAEGEQSEDQVSADGDMMRDSEKYIVFSCAYFIYILLFFYMYFFSFKYFEIYNVTICICFFNIYTLKLFLNIYFYINFLRYIIFIFFLYFIFLYMYNFYLFCIYFYIYILFF